MRQEATMKIKEYKFFKTPGKTARENKLTIADGIYYSEAKRLFDFSLLDKMEILEEEKEVIKNDAINNIRSSNKISIYGNQPDLFSYCFGNAEYHVQHVYSLDGRLRYNVFTLSRIEHNHCERKDMRDEYEHSCLCKSNGYDEPVFDVEL